MENAFAKAETFAAHVKEYINNRLTAVKLETAEKSSKLLSNMIAVGIVAAIMLVFVIFLSMGMSYLISEWIGVSWSGFLIVSGIWLLTAVVIWTGRESWLRMPIMNKMLKEMFKDEEDS